MHIMQEHTSNLNKLLGTRYLICSITSKLWTDNLMVYSKQAFFELK